MKKILCLSFVLVGCGGIVNYSPDGGEGGAGAQGGGGAGPGPNNSVTNAQSMDVVTTGPQSTCDVFCGQFSECFENQCFEICFSIYVDGCESEADAYLQCLIDVNPQNCGFDEGLCPAQEGAYSQCINSDSCFSDECSQSSGGGCDCFGECNGLKVEQYCLPSLDGGSATSVGASTGGAPPPPEDMFCNCFVSGDYVGDCFSSSFGCSLEEGCCQQYADSFD